MDTTTDMTDCGSHTIVFPPFVGQYYAQGSCFGVRMLVLGESHYGEASETTPEVTQQVVRMWAQQRRGAFFTKIAKLVLGLHQPGWLAPDIRAAAWEHFAFYNYVQGFAAEVPRQRPTPAMWTQAVAPLHSVLHTLAPQLILVLGTELYRHLEMSVQTDPRLCAIQHPSTGFRYDVWGPVFTNKLQEAREAAGLPPAVFPLVP